MKIALIITGLGMGGAERQVCELADNLSKHGHQILLISMTGETINRPRTNAIAVHSVGMHKSIAGFIKAYLKTRKIISAFKPDVVHSHMVHANIFSRLLRLVSPIPRLICTAHNTNEGGASRMLAYRLTDPLCDLSTNVSQEAVDIFIQRKAAPAHRMIAVHNGINTESFKFNVTSRIRLRNELGISEQTQLLLSVGRLTAAKDHPNLLESFSELLADKVNTRLAIIGSGEDESLLRKIASEKNLSGFVNFLGMRHDVADWMSAADVFVLSSAWEGFGLVVAEAMSCERVVVATDCGGVREVVGEAGLLVPPRQSHPLASAITKALNMGADERAKIGKFARQRVIEHYSLEAATQRWLDIYQGKAC